MKTSFLLALAGVMSLNLFCSNHARGTFAYSFTSGPWGDGFEWPASQRGNRTSSGAIAGDPFFSPGGVVFYNFSGNLAFFDSSNLLTRPANLINGDAWWTDPKLITGYGSFGSFSTASWLIDFSSIGGASSDFGFDVAIASVSAPTPETVAIIFDTVERFSVFASLDFRPVDQQGGFETPVFAQQTGTFFTLNSPHPGREGRFYFNIFELQQWIYDEAEMSEDFAGFYADPSEIIIEGISIRLRDLATMGGTTQIALDNFVYGGASVPPPLIEPTILPPLPEVGPNTPTYANYSANVEDLPENTGDNVRDILESELGADLSEVTAETGLTDVPDIGATASAVGSSIIFGSSTTGSDSGDVAAHEVIHTVQQGGEDVEGLDLSTNTLSPSSSSLDLPLKLLVTVNNLLQDGSGGLVLEGTAPDPQVISLTGSTLANLEANPSLDQQYQQNRAIVDSPGDAPAAAVFLQPRINVIILSSIGTLSDPPSFYYNYSAADYALLKEAQGEPMIEGESGSVVTPIVDEAGQIIDYKFSAWLVTDQSGTFEAFIANPKEPTPFQAWCDVRSLIYNYTFNPSFFHAEGSVDQKLGAHFALDGDPQSPENPRENWRTEFAADGGAEEYFTVTLPVRVGATFSGDPLTSAPVDGITYTIRADDDFTGDGLTVVERSSVVDTTGMPALHDLDNTPGPDWEYRSFRLAGPRSTADNAYFWVETSEAL